MPDTPAYRGYLSVLVHANQLPGLRDEGFVPDDVATAVAAIIADPPFSVEALPNVDTYDRLHAWRLLDADPALRAQLDADPAVQNRGGADAVLDRLLLTALPKERQAVLRNHPDLERTGFNDLRIDSGDQIGISEDDFHGLVDNEEVSIWAADFVGADEEERRAATVDFAGWLAGKAGGGMLLGQEIEDTAGTVLGALHFDRCDLAGIAHEVSCTADSVIVDAGPPATRIFASLVTDTNPPGHFEKLSDPECWPCCEPFFERMDRTGDMKLNLWHNPSTDYSGKEGILKETVHFDAPPFSRRMRTYLRIISFTRRPAPQDAPEAVGMTYEFNGSEDGEIDVDHGYILAQRQVGHPQRVHLSSQKTVRFRKLSNVLVPYMCLLGWGRMMRKMACCDKTSPQHCLQVAPTCRK